MDRQNGSSGIDLPERLISLCRCAMLRPICMRRLIHSVQHMPLSSLIAGGELIRAAGGDGVELGTSRSRHLVFLPGFLTPAGAYRELLEPVAHAGTAITVPQLYRPTPSVLRGSFTARDEAIAAALIVGSIAATGPAVFLGGHSRGGQAAWLAAEQLQHEGIRISGLVLIDPVDGGNPRVPERFATARSTDFGFDPLIVGAANAGRCAPEAVNHGWFARAAGSSRHVVIDGMGHADVLDGIGGHVARRLCRGSSLDPRVARERVAELIEGYIERASDSPNGP